MVDPVVQVIEITPKAAILLVSGHIDTASCEALHREISAVQANHNPRNIVLDVSLVEYISSAGIGLCTRLAQELAALGGRLAFVGMPAWVRQPIDMLGYTHFFDFWDSMYAAGETMAAD
ncbi:anti-sigma factor antagonist [bacterium]|nr:MAG: anti-sigma factor antagonist [bacterium]